MRVKLPEFLTEDNEGNKESYETLNGANGLSNIEGKVTRVGASERGQQTSFKR
jgi:hypothetical protein